MDQLESRNSKPGWWVALTAHIMFALASFYFSYLFFDPEASWAFVRNLGVAVTLWTSLGTTFNFVIIHGGTSSPQFAGTNVIILALRVLLCLAAMANHNNIVAHTIVIHGVLTVSLIWAFLARKYYARHSRLWHGWFDEIFQEDFKLWLIYFFSAYLPFYLPSALRALSPGGPTEAAHSPISISSSDIAKFADGITAFLLFFEFVTFWRDTGKQFQKKAKHDCMRETLDEPPLPDDGLERVLKTKSLRVGFLQWPPIVDCIGGTNGQTLWSPSGFYGRWLDAVAKKSSLQLLAQPVAWHEVKKQLRSGALDMLACALVTDSRKEYAIYSRPFHYCEMVGIARVGEMTWDVDAVRMPNVKVVVARNEVGFEYAREVLHLDPDHHNPKFTVIQTGKIDEVASIVLGGSADPTLYVGIADGLSIHRMQQAHPHELRVVLNDPALFTYPLAAMFAKGQTKLRDWIEAELCSTRRQPEIQAAEKEMMAELQRFCVLRKT